MDMPEVIEALSDIERLLKIAGDKCMPSLLQQLPELAEAKKIAYETWRKLNGETEGN